MADATTPEIATRPRLRAAGPALASAALALMLYAVTLGGTFVYDDVFIVRDDERLHDPSRWVEYWTSDYFAGGMDKLYRPLVSMSFAIQWRLHGDRAWAFHAVNWLLHAVVSALVAELARRLSGVRSAYFAGLLFAAHPVHVEAVANLVGRSELMCATGSLGALVLLARPPGTRLTPGRIAGIYACFILALLSKEQGMLLPLLLALLALACRIAPSSNTNLAGVRSTPDSVPDSRALPIPNRRNRQPALWLAFLLCATLAAYIVYRENTLRFWWDRSQLDWVMNPLVLSRGADRWLMPLVLLGRYTALLVAPWRLSIDYGSTVIGWEARAADPYLWLGAAALLTWLTLFAAAVARRAGAAAFCLLGVGITYGLIANFASLIGTILNERLLYLPSAFFLILIAGGAAGARRIPSVVVSGFIVILLSLASLRTVTYARWWNNVLAFYETSLREQPRSIQIHLLLGAEHRVRGSVKRSEEVMAEARRIAPDHPLVYNFSALTALASGDLDRADEYVRRSMSIEPSLQAVAIAVEVNKARTATQPSTRPAGE